MGSSGRVIALDINREFVRRTRERAREEGVGERLRVELLDGEGLPLADASVHRVVCKNVLEYVPDPQATVDEFRRVLRPDGIAHATDSDWGSLVLEPVADKLGLMRPVVQNMASYARASGRVEEAELEARLASVDRAVDEQTYLLVLPQFLVTDTA